MHDYRKEFVHKIKKPFPESSSPLSPTEGALAGPLSAIVMDAGDEPAAGFGFLSALGEAGEGFLGVPALVGVSMAALGGAATGGLAAESWEGAVIGASFNASIWSILTLVGSWKIADTKTKVILSGTTLLGAASTLYLYMKRHGKRRRG